MVKPEKFDQRHLAYHFAVPLKDIRNYCKPYFINKGTEWQNDRQNDEILNKDSNISENFNNYFVNNTKVLGMFNWAENS